jgi:hypothetical protein
MTNRTASLTSLSANAMVPSTATTYFVHLGRVVPTPQLGLEETRRVSDEDLQEFIRFHVVPRFKSFTVTHNQGYWKGSPEDTTTLTVVSEQYFDAIDIHKIAKEYCQRFSQEAVFINSVASYPNLVVHD